MDCIQSTQNHPSVNYPAVQFFPFLSLFEEMALVHVSAEEHYSIDRSGRKQEQDWNVRTRQLEG